jgi:hypothetical protein
MNGISLDSAVILTGISRRTFWRRLAEGEIVRLNNDPRGRTVLSINSLSSLLIVPVEPEDYELLIEADRGDPDAQNDLAQLFFDADQSDISLYWLQLAADQGHADAMHNLATLHIKGIGVAKDEAAGLMWLAKAATQGHQIAQAQIAALYARKLL